MFSSPDADHCFVDDQRSPKVRNRSEHHPCIVELPHWSQGWCGGLMICLKSVECAPWPQCWCSPWAPDLLSPISACVNYQRIWHSYNIKQHQNIYIVYKLREFIMVQIPLQLARFIPKRFAFINSIYSLWLRCNRKIVSTFQFYKYGFMIRNVFR